MNRRSANAVIKLNDEQKKKLIDEIRAFYLEERGEEIGMIEERQVLDLFCEQLAPIIYNKALDDALRWMKGQLENVEVDYTLLYRDER